MQNRIFTERKHDNVTEQNKNTETKSKNTILLHKQAVRHSFGYYLLKNPDGCVTYLEYKKLSGKKLKCASKKRV